MFPRNQLTESSQCLQSFWHLSPTASRWQAAELHMLPSRVRAWWRRSSSDSPSGSLLAVCGRCITGTSRGRLDPSTTCSRRVRSVSSSRSSSDVLNLKFYISSLLSFCFCQAFLKLPGEHDIVIAVEIVMKISTIILRTTIHFEFALSLTSQICLISLRVGKKNSLFWWIPPISHMILDFLMLLSFFLRVSSFFWLSEMVGYLTSNLCLILSYEWNKHHHQSDL